MAGVKIRIPLMVGSNGRWATCGDGDAYGSEEFSDWQLMGDNIMHKGPDDLYHDPETSVKMFIEVDIEVPSIEIKTARGLVIEK